MGKLTTHVLDTASGKPANGLRIELYRLTGAGAERQLLADVLTNQDGRIDRPMLDEAAFEIGQYELVFHAGDYLDRVASQGGTPLPEPKFLDVIPLRFGISSDSHYHVPLLISPFGYSTYRGS